MGGDFSLPRDSRELPSIQSNGSRPFVLPPRLTKSIPPVEKKKMKI